MTRKKSGTIVPATQVPAYEVRIMSTTDGRQCLPDVLQTIYGEKGIVAFVRYGRVIAVAVPLEAVRMLAEGTAEEGMEQRIRNSARNLIDSLKQEGGE